MGLPLINRPGVRTFMSMDVNKSGNSPLDRPARLIRLGTR